jgi:hypothetical protein
MKWLLQYMRWLKTLPPGVWAMAALFALVDLALGTPGVMLSQAIAGLRGTGDFGADERPKSFREMILWRRPNGNAPLTALLSKTASRRVDDPEFAHWEEELNAIRLQLNDLAGLSAASTAATVDGGDAKNLVAGDVLMVESAITTAYAHEIVVVSSVTSSTAIVIKRGQAGSTAAGIADNTFFTKIGNVFEEGSLSPDAATRNPTKLWNLVQIFKTAYRITETTKRTKFRTGDPLANDKKRKMFDHSVSLELAFLFGKRFETVGPQGKPLRYTGGLLHMLSLYASSRIVAFTTTPTEDTLLDAVYPIWDYSTDAGDERIVFAGNGALNSLNRLARNSGSTRINFNGTIKTYGMRLQQWDFPQGSLYVRTHPLFNTHGRFTNDILIIDPSALAYRYLRDTKPQDNIQARDADEQKGQWLTECGLEADHLKTMMWIHNFVVP